LPAQIAQRIILEAQQSDFDVLTNSAQGQTQKAQADSFTPFQMRSYAASDTAKNNPMLVPVFRRARQRSDPAILHPHGQGVVHHHLPRQCSHRSRHISPGKRHRQYGSRHLGAGVSLATILVQVAFNPSGKSLKVDSNLMFDLTQNKVCRFANFNAQIGRND